jgi:hypothetical protein
MNMSTYDEAEDTHPIDIAENLAEHHAWAFERINDDQVAMEIEAQWRTYAISVAWSPYDDTLRLVCTFEMEPPEESLPTLYQLLNAINDQCWSGAFTYWAEQQSMVYRYGLLLTGTNGAVPEQIETMVKAAVSNAERYYPAFALAIWGDRSPEEAIRAAMQEAYGRA